MTDLGHRPIGGLVVGDLVLGHDGAFHPVVATTRHPYPKPIYEIGVEGTNLSVCASDNHPFLVGRPAYDKTHITAISVGWVRSDEMRVGDFVLSPHPTLGDQEPFSIEEAWVVGLFLAEGSFQKAGHGANRYPVFHLHKDEQDFVTRLSDLYGDKVRVHPDRENGMAVFVFDATLGARLFAFCGQHSHKKSLPPSIWSISPDLGRAILHGYLDGDGCEIRGKFRAKTVSPDLASQIVHLADAVGFRAGLYRYPGLAGGIGSRAFKKVRDWYHIFLSPDSVQAGLKRHMTTSAPVEWEGRPFWLRRVKSITTSAYSGDVVNLTVEGCHTFQTAIGMSHNTQKPIDVLKKAIINSTKPGMLVLDFFGGSGSTLIACEDAGRTCYSLELDPPFADVIALRYEELTGRRGTLLRNGKEVKRKGGDS